MHTLLKCILLFKVGSSSNVNLFQRPTIVFHGLGVSCKSMYPIQKQVKKKDKKEDKKEDIEKQKQKLLEEKLKLLEENMKKIYCIETGDGFSSSKDLRVQAIKACKKITALIFIQKTTNPVFIYGFHLEGYSQGGLIARLLIKNCPKVKPYIVSLLLD